MLSAGARWAAQRLQQQREPPRSTERNGKSGHTVDGAGDTQPVARSVRRPHGTAVSAGEPRAATLSALARVLRREFASLLAAAAAYGSAHSAPDAPDDRKYDFSVIDNALTRLADRGMRLTLRVYAYSSCCKASYPDGTNIAIPDWERAIASTNTSYPGPATDPSTGVVQVVPNFNDSTYLNDFAQLLAALGRRYDGDERLSVFEFSGYGDFSENHVAYLRDTLGAPGPGPDESVATLGYYSQFRDQNITTASIKQLIAANVSAFPHTQLVTSPANPEIVRELFADEVTNKLAAPVGVRSDCLGVDAPLPAWAESSTSHYVQTKDPVVAALRQRLATAPVITEWCELPTGSSPRAYYEKGLRDVIRYHVSMTSSVNFPTRRRPRRWTPRCTWCGRKLTPPQAIGTRSKRSRGRKR